MHLYVIVLSSIISAQVTFESSVVFAPSSPAREAWATLTTALPALTLQAQEAARTEGGRTQRERYRLLTSRLSILIVTETERRSLYSSQEQRFVSQHSQQCYSHYCLDKVRWVQWTLANRQANFTIWYFVHMILSNLLWTTISTVCSGWRTVGRVGSVQLWVANFTIMVSC